jgi:hypothetical protein
MHGQPHIKFKKLLAHIPKYVFVILIVTCHHGTAGSQFERGKDAILVWNV